jgi:molecular chaperone DnaK
MASREITLGVDLGVSFSTAAALIDGRIAFALDARGEACIPSVVHVPRQGKPLVGAEAALLRQRRPEEVLAGFKRLMGVSWESGARRLIDGTSTMRLRRSMSGEVTMQTHTGPISPAEASSILLSYLKGLAEQRFGSEIRKVLLTVPVAFSAPAIEATKLAGRLAGFEEISILNEPCAAAYALARGLEKRQRFLVFDFGGGTMDAAVVDASAQWLKVLSARGDECLGGDDLDAVLSRHIVGELWQTEEIDAEKDRVLFDQILCRVELAKRALSASESTTLRLRDLPGRAHGFEFNVDRPLAERLWGPYLDRAVKVSAEALAFASMRPEVLDRVLLVGGSSRVPGVVDRVSKVFRRAVSVHSEPQLAVAAGAALAAQGRLRVEAGAAA